MEEFRLEMFIVLMLLEKNDNFRNSYSLTRVLHWQFGMLSDIEIRKRMVEDGLITRDHGNEKYMWKITFEGRKYLAKYFEKGRTIVFHSFPEKKEFLDVLFNGFVCPQT